MSRMIYCHYLKKEAPALDFKLYPGDLGQKIFDKISKEAWNKWMKTQTMLINEKKLSTMNPTHRKILESAMIDFLFEGKEITIDGYTPK